MGAPLIFFLFLLISSATAVVLLAGPKIPLLVNAPVRSQSSLRERIKRLMRNGGVSKIVSSQDVLVQRALSRARILLLRLEQVLARHLETLRRKSREKDERFSRDYWKGVKGRGSTKKKKSS